MLIPTTQIFYLKDQEIHQTTAEKLFSADKLQDACKNVMTLLSGAKDILKLEDVFVTEFQIRNAFKRKYLDLFEEMTKKKPKDQYIID